MKPLYAYFICLITVVRLTAQTPDKIVYLSKYDFTWQKDSTDKASVFHDIMYLEISDKNCRYYSYLKQLGLEQSARDQAAKKSIEYMMKNNTSYYPESETEIILHSYADKKRKVLDQFKNVYCYTETTVVPRWKIEKDTMTILAQVCQKATASYKGREYIAWFAPSIPYRLGPWELIGLPGLILRAYDTKKQFVFDCIELVKDGDMNNIYKSYANCKEAPRSKIKELKRLKVVDIQAFDQVEFGVTWVSKSTDGSSIPTRRIIKPYNPIDLTK